MVCNKFQRINSCTTQSSKKNITTKEDFFFTKGFWQADDVRKHTQSTHRALTKKNLTQTATVNTFTSKYTHKHRLRGTSVSHRSLFIEAWRAEAHKQRPDSSENWCKRHTAGNADECVRDQSHLTTPGRQQKYPLRAYCFCQS